MTDDRDPIQVIHEIARKIEAGERQALASAPAPLDELEPKYIYVWRVRTRFPERFGQPCRMLVRGKMNSCLIEFEDGFKTVTSRNFIKRAKP